MLFIVGISRVYITRQSIYVFRMSTPTNRAFFVLFHSSTQLYVQHLIIGVVFGVFLACLAYRIANKNGYAHL